MVPSGAMAGEATTRLVIVVTYQGLVPGTWHTPGAAKEKQIPRTRSSVFMRVLITPAFTMPTVICMSAKP